MTAQKAIVMALTADHQRCDIFLDEAKRVTLNRVTNALLMAKNDNFTLKRQKVKDKYGCTAVTESLLNSYIRELAYYEKCAQIVYTEKAKKFYRKSRSQDSFVSTMDD